MPDAVRLTYAPAYEQRFRLLSQVISLVRYEKLTICCQRWSGGLGSGGRSVEPWASEWRWMCHRRQMATSDVGFSLLRFVLVGTFHSP